MDPTRTAAAAPSAEEAPFWRLPRYYLPLLIGALVNAGVYVGVTYRLATKQERLSRELVSLNETTAARWREIEELRKENERVAGNEAIANQFWSEALGPLEPGLTETVAEIDQLARDAGVERGRTAYKQKETELGLIQVNATMPVRGSYFDLVGFVNRIERSRRHFLLQSIELGRAAEEGELELRCEIAFFLRNEVAAGEVSQ